MLQCNAVIVIDRCPPSEIQNDRIRAVWWSRRDDVYTSSFVLRCWLSYLSIHCVMETRDDTGLCNMRVLDKVRVKSESRRERPQGQNKQFIVALPTNNVTTGVAAFLANER
jgi:hypothetical protein